MASPMSWIDRINAAIVRRIQGNATLRADALGVELSGRRLAYADLQHAIAYRHPNPIGDDLSLALDFGDGRIVTVSENDAAWRTVLSGLDGHPRNQRLSTDWTLLLVAGAEDVRIELL
jgi:hypothetical protein